MSDQILVDRGRIELPPKACKAPVLPLSLTARIGTSYWVPRQPSIERLLCPSFLSGACVQKDNCLSDSEGLPRYRSSATGPLSLVKRYFKESSNRIWWSNLESNQECLPRGIGFTVRGCTRHSINCSKIWNLG